MSEEFPFRTEYAKSNRSSCNHCHDTISKDSLRLAKMVQSPKFDGKIPNWYHYKCFFKVARIADVNQVAGLGALRWEDQQKIRDKASGGGAEEAEEVDSSTPTRPASEFYFEMAPSGRSSCRLCGVKIPKNDIRVSYNYEYTIEYKEVEACIPYHHHLKCFAENLPKLNAVGIDPKQIQFFENVPGTWKEKILEAFPLPASASKKRKADNKEKGEGGTKKKPKEDPQEKVLRLQTEKLWKVRDQLQSSLSQAELKSMLEANSQEIPSGESRLLDRCADGMVFGALEPCSTCQGQLTVGTHGYFCTGNISAWSKCQVKTQEATRKKWVIPSDLMEYYDFLSKYKYKPQVRAFPPSKVDAGSEASTSKKLKPLHGFTVVLVGRLKKTQNALTERIQSLGGTVVSSVKKDTTICISYKDLIKSGGSLMQKVKDCDVPVVDVDFLDDATKGEALSKILPHTISPWGAPRHALSSTDETDFEALAFEKDLGKTKFQVKKGSVVDPDSGLEYSHHVLEEPPKTLYNAVLGMVDIVKGTNSYYKLQVLESDRGGNYQLFRAWGRVGTTIGGNKLENHRGNRKAAMQAFEQLYAEKTGNLWENRQSSTKVAGKFYPLEVDYGEDEESDLKLDSSVDSRLPHAIQELVHMIFDVESMKKAMSQFEIDMKKMPLGKLSKRQLESAFTVLSTLLEEIKGARNPSRILDGSNQFYTLIPHDFGMKKPPLLDSEDAIRNKTLMVENLMEIELAYSMLKEARAQDLKSPLDVHFEQLKTDMEVVSKGSDDFKMIVEYVANTHGATHDSYDLEVLEVFRVDRHGESKRFDPFSKLHNRMLLWHGSRRTNFVGILSQGLRIAPPEAPVSGYMFGKGVYFADMVSKSANYCFTSPQDDVGLMMLCEVALGNMYEKTHSEYVSKLPDGKHSTKGIGRTMPDPQAYRVTDTGVVVPMGKGISSPAGYTSLLYNEYIVYDVSQINIKFLLKMKFNYKRVGWW